MALGAFAGGRLTLLAAILLVLGLSLAQIADAAAQGVQRLGLFVQGVGQVALAQGAFGAATAKSISVAKDEKSGSCSSITTCVPGTMTRLPLSGSIRPSSAAIACSQTLALCGSSHAWGSVPSWA